MGDSTLTVRLVRAALALALAALPLGGCVAEAVDSEPEDEAVAEAQGEIDFDINDVGHADPGDEVAEDNPKGGPEPTPWRRTERSGPAPGDPVPLSGAPNDAPRTDN